MDKPYIVDLGTNKVYIEKDGVTMKEAKCPDKVCIEQGKIKSRTEAIICMPNKVVVEYKGSSKGPDAVAGAR